MEQATRRGRFIVFEGIDGAGKTTQIELLAKHLQAAGRRVYRTAEPTESVTGGLLRDALSGVSRRTAAEMAALFTLDRIFHNVNPVNGIEKMLADGVGERVGNGDHERVFARDGSSFDVENVRRGEAQPAVNAVERHSGVVAERA